MVDLQKIKDEVAVKHGYSHWLDFISTMLTEGWSTKKLLKLENEAMHEHSKQCCQLQIEACAENVLHTTSDVPTEFIESILNTKNVCDDK